MLTSEQLKKCLPKAAQKNIELYLDPINKAFEEFEINTPKRMAAFIAQVGHESGQLNFVRENLNYKAESLTKVFRKYFPTLEEAQKYDRNPEKIANKVYASRMGNGDESSGDGFKYRGRGLIQVTGKSNYESCGKSLGEDLNKTPEYLETPDGAVRSAGWFWNRNKLNVKADASDTKGITKTINGGFNGLEEREHLYDLAIETLS